MADTANSKTQQQAFDILKQWVAQAQPQQQQSQAHANPLLHALMMALQGADALNTSNFLKKPGTYETDPLMKPFAQAGNPLGMMGAYGMENKAIGALPSAGQQNNASILQILLNLAGLARTQHANKTGH